MIRRRRQPIDGQGFGGLRRVIAIDLDGSTLRVAEAVRGGGESRITRLVTERLPDVDDLPRDDAQRMGAWLAETLKRLKVGGAPVVMAIPRGQVMLKPFSLPAAQSMGELVAMARLQVARELPFPVEQAVIDLTVQEHFDGSTASEAADEGAAADDEAAAPVNVLAAVVRREVVEHYQQMIAAAGLKLAALGLRSYANVRCVAACHGPSPRGSVALVYLRSDEVLIDVLRERWLTFSRAAALTLPIDPPTETDDPAADTGEQASAAAAARKVASAERAKRVIDGIGVEVTRSLHSYQGMGRHERVQAVVLAGDTGVEQAAADHLAKRLKLPCRLLDPGAALKLRDGDRALASASIAAIGLALGATEPSGLPFNFLDPKRPPAPRHPKRQRILLATAAGIALLIGGIGGRSYLFQQRDKPRQAMMAEIAQIRPSVRAYRLLLLQEQAIQAWMDADRKWLDHWAYLSGVLPPSEQVYASSFTTSLRGTVRLDLQVRDQQALAALDQRVRDAGYGVRPMAVTPGNDPHGYPFKTTLELTLPEALQLDLAAHQPPARPSDDASLDPPGEPRARRR